MRVRRMNRYIFGRIKRPTLLRPAGLTMISVSVLQSRRWTRSFGACLRRGTPSCGYATHPNARQSPASMCQCLGWRGVEEGEARFHKVWVGMAIWGAPALICFALV